MAKKSFKESREKDYGKIIHIGKYEYRFKSFEEWWEEKQEDNAAKGKI